MSQLNNPNECDNIANNISLDFSEQITTSFIDKQLQKVLQNNQPQLAQFNDISNYKQQLNHTQFQLFHIQYYHDNKQQITSIHQLESNRTYTFNQAKGKVAGNYNYPRPVSTAYKKKKQQILFNKLDNETIDEDTFQNETLKRVYHDVISNALIPNSKAQYMFINKGNNDAIDIINQYADNGLINHLRNLGVSIFNDGNASVCIKSDCTINNIHFQKFDLPSVYTVIDGDEVCIAYPPEQYEKIMKYIKQTGNDISNNFIENKNAYCFNPRELHNVGIHGQWFNLTSGSMLLLPPNWMYINITISPKTIVLSFSKAPLHSKILYHTFSALLYYDQHFHQYHHELANSIKTIRLDEKNRNSKVAIQYKIDPFQSYLKDVDISSNDTEYLMKVNHDILETFNDDIETTTNKMNIENDDESDSENETLISSSVIMNLKKIEGNSNNDITQMDIDDMDNYQTHEFMKTDNTDNTDSKLANDTNENELKKTIEQEASDNKRANSRIPPNIDQNQQDINTGSSQMNIDDVENDDIDMMQHKIPNEMNVASTEQSVSTNLHNPLSTGPLINDPDNLDNTHNKSNNPVKHQASKPDINHDQETEVNNQVSKPDTNDDQDTKNDQDTNDDQDTKDDSFVRQGKRLLFNHNYLNKSTNTNSIQYHIVKFGAQKVEYKFPIVGYRYERSYVRNKETRKVIRIRPSQRKLVKCQIPGKDGTSCGDIMKPGYAKLHITFKHKHSVTQSQIS